MDSWPVVVKVASCPDVSSSYSGVCSGKCLIDLKVNVRFWCMFDIMKEQGLLCIKESSKKSVFIPLELHSQLHFNGKLFLSWITLELFVTYHKNHTGMQVGRWMGQTTNFHPNYSYLSRKWCFLYIFYALP